MNPYADLYKVAVETLLENARRGVASSQEAHAANEAYLVRLAHQAREWADKVEVSR
jgi:hypothetical protein